MAAKKDFTTQINNNDAFDGQGVSQTYEEREAEKGKSTGKNKPKEQSSSNKTTEMRQNVKAKAVQEEEAQETRRVTLYLPARLYKRLSMVSTVEETSMNQIIINSIENEITDERVKAALNKVANLA